MVLITTQQRELVERLKTFAETDLYIANKVLNGEANEYELEIALHLCHLLGIK